MMFKTIVSLIILLMVCSCSQKTSNGAPQTEKGPKQHLGSKIGLNIENRINRGARFTDSEGDNYWLIHIASTITNDSIIPIQIQIEFSRTYDYPIEYGDQQFNIFLLPKVFSLDGVQVVTDHSVLTDSMQVKLQQYIENGLDTPYKLHKTLAPGEKCVVAIGTLFPDPPKSCGIFPNVLFTHSEVGLFPTCDWLMEEDPSANPQIALGLKLNICQGGPRVVDGKNYSPTCMIIPCGQISYPQR